MTASPPPLVVYHGDCPDGFTAAWLLRRHLHAIGQQPVLLAATHGAPPVQIEQVADRDVWMLDFSYRRDTLLALAEAARSFTLLDHHSTAADELAGDHVSLDHLLAAPHVIGNGIVMCVDDRYSGCGIVARVLRALAGEAPPEWVWAIERMDLDRPLSDEERCTVASVTSYDYNFERWDELAARCPQLLVAEGRPVIRLEDRLLDQIVAGAYRVQIADLPVWVGHSTFKLGGMVARRLAERESHGVGGYVSTGNPVQIGLRAADWSDVDVSQLARSFGGGGRQRSAAFRLPRYHNDLLVAALSIDNSPSLRLIA